jgi:hypothetical protein
MAIPNSASSSALPSATGSGIAVQDDPVLLQPLD